MQPCAASLGSGAARGQGLVPTPEGSLRQLQQIDRRGEPVDDAFVSVARALVEGRSSAPASGPWLWMRLQE
jgi:hypothetical protein